MIENTKVAIYDAETKHLLHDVGNRPEKLGFVCGIILDFHSSLIAFYKDPKIMVDHLLNQYDVIMGFNNKDFDNVLLSGLTQPYLNPAEFLNKEVTFGKYRGMKWDLIPDDYLKWLISEDTNYSKVAKSILQNKKQEIPFIETSEHVKNILNNKSIDLFEILRINTSTKYPASLNDCCKLTINKEKFEGVSGGDIPKLYEEKNWDLIESYQIQDGDITKELFQFILQYGYCLIPQIKGSENHRDLCIKVPINLDLMISNIKEKNVQ